MKATEVMKKVKDEQNITLSTIASRMGKMTGNKEEDKKTLNVLTKRFSQDNISIALLNEMLRAMDYKVVVMPVSDRTPKNAYEVD